MIAGRRARERLRHLVIYTDAVGIGGAEISVRYLLEHLDARFDVTVVGIDPTVVESIAAGRAGARAAVLAAVRNRYDVAAIAAHLRTVRRLRPDVVHANLGTSWSGSYGILSAITAPGVRTVAVEHLPLRPRTPRQLQRKRWLVRRLAAHVTVGERSARDLEAWWQLSPGSVRTIHNGVPDRPLARLQRPAAEFVVGPIGRLHPQKGYDLLLGAAASVDGGTIVLVGAGEEQKRLGELAQMHGLEERLVFTGWLDDPRSQLPTFDVFVLPSRYEAFPLSILEAMLAGVPVVATDVGSVREAVIDGQTGLLVPPDDPRALAEALRALREDSELRRRLAANALELARSSFTADVMARAYEKLYAEII